MPNKIHNSNERFLIVTADDFGMCHSMNEAIMNLYQADAINSSMIMMPGPWAKEALSMPKIITMLMWEFILRLLRVSRPISGAQLPGVPGYSR